MNYLRLSISISLMVCYVFGQVADGKSSTFDNVLPWTSMWSASDPFGFSAISNAATKAENLASITALSAHTNSTDNPHHVTAAQAGAVGIANFISATNTIANTPSWRIVDNVTNAQAWIDGTGCVWKVDNSSIKLTILSGEGEGIHILKKTDNYIKEEGEIAKEDGGLSLARGKYYEEGYYFYRIGFESGYDYTFTKDTPIPSKNEPWINHQNDLYMEEYFTTNLVGRLALTNDVVTKDTRNLYADIATNMVWKTVISNGYLYVVAYTNDTSILR